MYLGSTFGSCFGEGSRSTASVTGTEATEDGEPKKGGKNVNTKTNTNVKPETDDIIVYKNETEISLKIGA